MTDKDLHKLSREDLLKLMLAQSKELTRQKTIVSKMTTTAEENTASIDRLKAKLDEKDETIERLKGRLNEKDALLEKLKKSLDDKDKLLEEKQEELDNRLQGAPQSDEYFITLQKENASLLQQVGELNGEIGELKAQLAQKESELKRCKEKLDVLNERQPVESLDDLDLLIDDFNEKNRKLVEQLNAKEAQLDSICRMTSERDNLETIIREQFAELKAGFAQAAPVQADTLDQEREIQELNSKLEQRDNEIRELWTRIWSLVGPKD